jgi:Flp pilus assembly protein TadG
MLYHRRSRRCGTVAVEMAIVYPVFFFLLVALIVGGLGVLRYCEAAWLAREGARWASVRGGEYVSELKQPATTQQSVFQNAIKPKAFLMDPTQLTCTVAWDDASQLPTYQTGSQSRTNYVRVTVSYSWLPEAFLGRMTLTSTSEMPVSY